MDICLSTQVRSRYMHTSRDLLASGHSVYLIVHARHFFHQQCMCIRKVCAEHFPFRALPRAKFVLWLQESFRQLVFAIGGETAKTHA